MLVNDVDIKKYAASFDQPVVQSVFQFLETFKCCDQLTDALKLLTVEAEELKREVAESFSSRSKGEAQKNTHTPKQRPLETVVGMCPTCSGIMRGEPSPGCDREKSGRIFYTECGTCTYYYEIFQNKRTKKYKKIEGGII
jgi:hypothetical protein